MRKCKFCHNLMPIGAPPQQFYCSRKCARSHYYQKVEKPKKVPPTYLCPHCGVQSDVGFQPIRKPKLWDKFACPACGVRRNYSE